MSSGVILLHFSIEYSNSFFLFLASNCFVNTYHCGVASRPLTFSEKIRSAHKTELNINKSLKISRLAQLLHVVWPSEKMLRSLGCASGCPWSAAILYQWAASAVFSITPQPVSKLIPKAIVPARALARLLFSTTAQLPHRFVAHQDPPKMRDLNHTAPRRALAQRPA